MIKENSINPHWLALYGELAEKRAKAPDSISADQQRFLNRMEEAAVILNPDEVIAAELASAFSMLTERDNVIQVDFRPQKLPPLYRIAAQSEETTGELFRVLQRAQDLGRNEIYLGEIIDLPDNGCEDNTPFFTLHGNHVTLHAPQDIEMVVSVGGLDEELDPGEAFTLLLNVLQKASLEFQIDPSSKQIKRLTIA